MEKIRKFELGDIIKVKSIFSRISPKDIWHYGVVVGEETVVHFNLDDEFDITIIETDLQEFIGLGHDLQKCMISHINREFEPSEIVQRALSCVGSDFGGYNLISNNCEHFANWCASGTKFSNQAFFVDEGEEHGVAEKLLENLVAEPILKKLDKVNDVVETLQEKTESVVDFIEDILGTNETPNDLN